MMVCCLVLAGGKGRRLGRDKTEVVLGGVSLLDRVVKRLAPLGPVKVVGLDRPWKPPPGVEVMPDLYPGKGTLGGLYTGLKACFASHALAVGCDMPFLHQSLLEHLIALSPSNDAVVPRIGGLFEPLHAVYSRSCLGPLKSLLHQNRLSLLELFPLVRVRYVEEDEIDRFDPQHLSFFNINTPADLERAQKLLEHPATQH